MQQVAGAIIAGGQSRRFGDDNKLLAQLNGVSLIERVYKGISTQVDKVWLNAPDSLELPEMLRSLCQISDANMDCCPPEEPGEKPSKKGPLTGVLPSLHAATEAGYPWLLIAPCDTPFIPDNLAEKLLEQCLKTHCKLAIAQSADRIHPSLSLWHRSLLEPLSKAVIQQRKSGFKQFYPQVDHDFVTWSTSKYDPFFNINFATDLEAAADIINNNPHLK